MPPVFDQPSLLQRVAPWFRGFDVWLSLAVMLLSALFVKPVSSRLQRKRK